MWKCIGQVFRRAFVGGMSMRVEQYKPYHLEGRLFMQMVSHTAQGDLRCFCHGVSKSTRGDGRKTNGVTVEASCLFHAVAVAALEDLRLIHLSALPHGSHRMDDVTGLEIARWRGYSLARRETSALVANFAAFFKKRWTGGAMNCTINASAAEQGRVGGIHNGIDRFMHYVAL
jgi:hypothetical protein